MEEDFFRSETFINDPSIDTFAGTAARPAADADFPYAQQLLAESFRHWIGEADSLRENNGLLVLLCNAEGVPVAASPEEGANMPAGLLRAAALAAASAAESRCPETAAYAGAGVACTLAAVPVTSAQTDGPIAVMVAASPASRQPDGAAVMLEARGFALHFRSCFYRTSEHMFVKDLLAQHRMAEKFFARREKLFLAAKRLQDQIDVTSVLNEILSSMESLYPGAPADLFLSQDYVYMDARVKPLLFRRESNELCARSFLEGKPLKEQGEHGEIRVAVPLAGKQAVYGIVQLTAESSQWDDADMPAFIMLAEAAGTAFENAKLHEQSHLLIRELRLINELTKRLNQSLRLKEIYKFTTEELLHIFEADFSCLLQYNKETGQFSVASCNVPSMDNELFSGEYGFCGVVFRSREPLIVSDYSPLNNVPSRLMELTNARSLIASPILVDGEVAAVILVAHRAANFFSYDNYKLLQVLSTHIGLAVTNASLHAEVRRMVITDNLTGLRARHYLNEQIQQRQRKDACGSLILVDIDYFKQVNDTFGHQTGDRILTQVSDVIRSCIRETDIAARWGGEELAVYLPKIRAEQAFRIADRIRARVAAETDPVVTVSCGVSEWLYEDDKVSVESLFYRADMALYGAKHNGRNRVYIG